MADENVLRAELKRLDQEGAEVAKRLKELEYKERNADGRGPSGYIFVYLIFL